jgi:translation initiation factor IF-2
MSQKNNNSSVRPPVVAVMGHVDHGKSTILDYIRKTNIVDREAGGITQHVSAYEVEHQKDGVAHKITFLDTPGHEAFSGIRMRGAHVADVAILVVSAEEGVKPQTLEAYKHIKAKNLPMIVALNKIDRPNANAERVKQNLAEHEIYVESYGGDVPAIPTSATTGAGIPELLDMILLVAEIQELTGDPSLPASGVVLESKHNPQKGITATLIIKNGTLKKGSFVVAGSTYAPVRIVSNFLGKPIDSATFSSPVQIVGWSDLPTVGDAFTTVDSKQEAEELVAEVLSHIAKKQTTAPAQDGVVTIPVVIKADAAGSLEAIHSKLLAAQTDKVSVRILHEGLGVITEQDIKTANVGEDTLVIGFGVKIDKASTTLAERMGITVHSFDIIYKLTEWFEAIVLERTPTVDVEEVVGKLKVLRTFSSTRDKQVIGGKVQEGTLTVGDKVNIVRRSNPIGIGYIRELQNQKIKTSTIDAGNECGTMIESKLEIATGDVIDAFRVVKK